MFFSFSEPKGRDKPLRENTSSILGEVIPPGFFRVTVSSSSNAISQGPSTAHLSLICDPCKRRELHSQHLSLQDICSQPPLQRSPREGTQICAGSVSTAITQTHSIVHSVHCLGDRQEEVPHSPPILWAGGRDGGGGENGGKSTLQRCINAP